VSTSSIREQLIRQFQDKEFRDLFVAEHIYARLPLKIRALREQREWTQKQLGERAGMAQTWVSKLEDPNYGQLTIATLLKLASAFDVALSIDFITFSQILHEAVSLSPESFQVPSLENDQEFHQKEAASSRPPTTAAVTNEPVRTDAFQQSNNTVGKGNTLLPEGRPAHMPTVDFHEAAALPEKASRPLRRRSTTQYSLQRAS